MTEPMWQALSLIAGCITTATTLLYTKERQKRRNQPNRIDSLLDGYEKLIRDNDHKGKLIGELELSIGNLRVEMNKSQGIIELLKEELEYSRAQIDNLNQQLVVFKQKSA